MNLYPLLVALFFIVVYALIVAFWKTMDADAKRLLFIVTAVAVVLCIIAVFWPIFPGHSMRVT